MKKISILIAFLLTVAVGQAQIKLAGYIRPLGDADTYPVTLDSLAKGGLQVTYNRTTRNAIPSDKRKVGMYVSYSSADSLFKLVGGIDNDKWVYKGSTSTIGDITGLQAILDGKASDNDVLHKTGNETKTGLLTLNNGIGQSLNISGDLYLGSDYLTGGGSIQLDNTYGNNLIGNLMPKIPTNDSQFIGITFFGDAVGNNLDLTGSDRLATSSTWIGAYAGREAKIGGSGATIIGAAAAGGWKNLGSSITAVGTQSLFKTVTDSLIGSFTTALGAGTGRDATADNSLYLGYGAGTNNTQNGALIIDNKNSSNPKPLIQGQFFDYFGRYVEIDGRLIVNDVLIFKNVPEYIGNSAAIAAGLTVGRVYRTGDALKIVH